MTTVTKETGRRWGLGLALVGVVVLATGALAAQDAHLKEQAQLKQTRACDGCDLTGVNFGRADLKGVSLSGAKLVGASFYKIDLSNANFGGADLSKANLTLCNLTNVNFGSANLAGANLSGSTGAGLASAVTTETTTCPDGQAGPCR